MPEQPVCSCGASMTLRESDDPPASFEVWVCPECPSALLKPRTEGTTGASRPAKAPRD